MIAFFHSQCCHNLKFNKLLNIYENYDDLMMCIVFWVLTPYTTGSLTLWRNTLTSSSGSNSKPSKKPRDVGGKLRSVTLKIRDYMLP
jgi:hypothetical protein